MKESYKENQDKTNASPGFAFWLAIALSSSQIYLVINLSFFQVIFTKGFGKNIYTIDNQHSNPNAHTTCHFLSTEASAKVGVTYNQNNIKCLIHPFYLF
jgi:hypothetical protein